MKHLAILIGLGFLLSACVKNNPQPVWLSINAWTLTTNPDVTANDPGALTHNFTDAWVYVDNKLIGVFQVPCKIPVLASGSKEVKIYPTVRNNGISATKKTYPFCSDYTVIMDLVEGQSYTINPTTYYKTGSDFWIEDFTENSVHLTQDENSTATITQENDPAIAITGYYGHVHLSEGSALWLATLSEALDLPQGGSEVYLEFDYRADSPTLTGMFALGAATGTTQNDHVIAQANELQWKRMYIDFKEIVSYSVNANSFLPYFNAELPNSATTADIYIDNIKIVHF